MTTASRARVANDPISLARLEDLLIRYPAVSPAENAEIGTLLRSTGPLDMGLLSSNASAWPQAELYRRDHPTHFRMSWKERGFWLVSAALAVAALVFAWDMGVP
ncbi:hypothetical protein GCM10022281_17230 [Sphingomonas rosea]|uniref:Uncharacterized protein n=1 Tax=Sphingomonas rosea TaxID=335605 RepID=A0ABP7U7G9_9SPHN